MPNPHEDNDVGWLQRRVAELEQYVETLESDRVEVWISGYRAGVAEMRGEPAPSLPPAEFARAMHVDQSESWSAVTVPMGEGEDLRLAVRRHDEVDVSTSVQAWAAIERVYERARRASEHQLQPLPEVAPAMAIGGTLVVDPGVTRGELRAVRRTLYGGTRRRLAGLLPLGAGAAWNQVTSAPMAAAMTNAKAWTAGGLAAGAAAGAAWGLFGFPPAPGVPPGTEGGRPPPAARGGGSPQPTPIGSSPADSAPTPSSDGSTGRREDGNTGEREGDTPAPEPTPERDDQKLVAAAPKPTPSIVTPDVSSQVDTPAPRSTPTASASASPTGAEGDSQDGDSDGGRGGGSSDARKDTDRSGAVRCDSEVPRKGRSGCGVVPDVLGPDGRVLP